MTPPSTTEPGAGDQGSPPLEIPVKLLDAMLDHCRRDAPFECCGILGGVPPLVLSLHPLRNIAASETRYRADEKDLIQAVVFLRGRCHEILAIYHSHPRWKAVPSQTDLSQNYWGEMPRIIVSLLTEPPDVRIWRLNPDSFQELSWKLIRPDATADGSLQPTAQAD
jgi:proteasome lid subunit RPN8/RPN11